MKTVVCAYCEKNFEEKRKRTAEHIFPQALLELYPKQDISYTPERIFKDNSGLTIADVCAVCNNGVLSELDSYGCSLIREEFYKEIDFEDKDKEVQKEIDYEHFSKWIIKIAYNYYRSRKKDCAFLQKYISSIVKKNCVPEGFTIFLGLHLNTTPLPDKCYDYLPLTIIENPKLLGTCLGMSMLFDMPIDMNSIDVQGTYEKLLIRLGNLVVYLVFWKEKDAQKIYEEFICKNFNFRKLKKGTEKYKLLRVAASTNMSMNYGHLLSTSALHQDDMVVAATMNGTNIKDARKIIENSRTEKDWRKSQLLVEKDMFPNNRKVEKEYGQMFNEKD